VDPPWFVEVEEEVVVVEGVMDTPQIIVDANVNPPQVQEVNIVDNIVICIGILDQKNVLYVWNLYHRV